MFITSTVFLLKHKFNWSFQFEWCRYMWIEKWSTYLLICRAKIWLKLFSKAKNEIKLIKSRENMAKFIFCGVLATLLFIATNSMNGKCFKWKNVAHTHIQKKTISKISTSWSVVINVIWSKLQVNKKARNSQSQSVTSLNF